MGKRLKLVTAVIVVSSVLFGGVQATAASVKVGAKCTKVNAKAKTLTKQEVVCKRKSGKLKWVLSVVPVVTPPVIDYSGDYLSDPNASTLSLYSGGPGPGGNSGIKPAASVELPFAAPAGSSQFNVKLWTYQPTNSSFALGSPGVFVNDSKGWVFHALTSDGYLLENWGTGVYSVDTIEPNGDSKTYKRHTYVLTVKDNGEVSVEGLLPNQSGFFTLTVDLVTQVQSDPYNPTTPCQVKYQVADDSTLSSGFPRKSARLPNKGKIRALIIPVDFSDVPGSGNPESVFFDMAKGTHDFYKKMSAGSVFFDFKIVKDWQRQSFKSTEFNLGTWNGGNSMGYYKALVAAADPVVDYSQFDVVYFLSPPSIPWSSIFSGPAFPTTVQTADGPLRAGTYSGADAYSNTATVGDGWKWMSHETGHLFGLHDLYTNGTPSTYGAWDLMSLNWSNEFIELNSWNRYISGWLTDDQIKCLTPDSLSATATKVQLEPVERTGSGFRAAVVPIDSYTVLVVESRRSEGLDKSTLSQPAGTLVYTVDMRIRSIKGGWHLIVPSRSKDIDQFRDGALRVGESVTVSGITVSVVSQDSTGDTVTLTR